MQDYYKDLALKTLAMFDSSAYVECRAEERTERSFVLKNGVLSAASSHITRGIGGRFIENGLGFFSTNLAEEVEAIGRNALSINKTTRLAEKVELSGEAVNRAKVEVKQKKPLHSVSVEQCIELLNHVDQTLQDTGVKFAARFFTLELEEISRFFANSQGSEVEFTFPRISFHYIFTLATGGQRYWQRGACAGLEVIDNWNLPQLVASEAIALDKAAETHAPTPWEPQNLVVGPEVTGIIAHESCGHPYEADRVMGREAAQAGESFLNLAMRGQRFADDCVSVIDDPTIENSYGFFKFDDEGTAAKPKNLINRGKINALLSDRIHASILGEKSSANSRCSGYNMEPLIRMSNTFFKPDSENKSEEELIEEAKNGVYIKNFMEWNIDDTRFNQKYVGSEAYLIENGEITKPLLNPVLEITTPALYSAIKAVGNNLEFHAASCGKGEPMQGMPVWMGGPSMLIQKVKLR